MATSIMNIIFNYIYRTVVHLLADRLCMGYASVLIAQQVKNKEEKNKDRKT